MTFSNDEPKRTRSETLSSKDDIADLFEDLDSDNEEFIKALDSDPKSTAPALDDVVPDIDLAESQTQDSSPSQPTSDSGSLKEPATSGRAQNSTESMTPLEKIPVSISLEIGTISCSLQKLIDLQPNDLLELNQPVGQSLDLRVDGKLIGKGEIVRLGDQLGLRISDLADR